MTESEHSAVRVGKWTMEDIHTVLETEPGSLFAILDACDEPRVPQKVDELEDRAVSLYRGSAERDCWAIAPYLAQVDEGLLDWIVENLWDDPWGILAQTTTDLAKLRTHFRRFLMVEDPDGDKMYFRFYDPRVLSTFLTNCTESEAEEFFGPIRRFCVADKEKTLTILEREGATTSAPVRNA